MDEFSSDGVAELVWDNTERLSAPAGEPGDVDGLLESSPDAVRAGSASVLREHDADTQQPMFQFG